MFCGLRQYPKNNMSYTSQSRVNHVNGTPTQITKGALDFLMRNTCINLANRSTSILREGEKLLIFKPNILLMQDRFGFSWRMKSIFYLAMVSLTSQACSK